MAEVDDSVDSENHLNFCGNASDDSEMITIAIDLSDPDDIIKKLELIDLTDEETDSLLDRANELNVFLRQQLEMQSNDDADLWHESSNSGDQSMPLPCMMRSPSFLVSAPMAKMANRRHSGPLAATCMLPPLTSDADQSCSRHDDRHDGHTRDVFSFPDVPSSPLPLALAAHRLANHSPGDVHNTADARLKQDDSRLQARTQHATRESGTSGHHRKKDTSKKSVPHD